MLYYLCGSADLVYLLLYVYIRVKYVYIYNSDMPRDKGVIIINEHMYIDIINGPVHNDN